MGLGFVVGSSEGADAVADGVGSPAVGADEGDGGEVAGTWLSGAGWCGLVGRDLTAAGGDQTEGEGAGERTEQPQSPARAVRARCWMARHALVPHVPVVTDVTPYPVKMT